MIIADTGFWLALASSGDRHNQIAQDFLKKHQPQLITTWPVLTETCHLLLSRVGIKAQLTFIESYRRRAFDVFEIAPDSRDQIMSLMEKYQALPMDLADASLILLAESLNSGQILSTDKRDFRTYRWKNHYPFENLLLPD